ncbi:MAG: thioredoxin domain-containing protein [Thermomicrobiales bacterium]
MTNRLAGESSPYLLQHQNNPVDWRPWSAEAFAEARATDRPLLVSIGYSSCHWCHVMAHESFENAETAALMNEWFICVKVDREERPDVDALMMTAVQAMTGGGGWPLHAFLTADGVPFYGGTYWPPRTDAGCPVSGACWKPSTSPGTPNGTICSKTRTRLRRSSATPTRQLRCRHDRR